MTQIAAIAFGAAMALGPSLVLAADNVPTLNVEPSCRSAAAASIMTGRNTENCVSDENNARDLLKKSWKDFSAADKAHCDSLEQTGGPPSYVELLSCLEMSRDARVMARDNAKQSGSSNRTPGDTTGAGTPMKELPEGTQPVQPRNKR